MQALRADGWREDLTRGATRAFVKGNPLLVIALSFTITQGKRMALIFCNGCLETLAGLRRILKAYVSSNTLISRSCLKPSLTNQVRVTQPLIPHTVCAFLSILCRRRFPLSSPPRPTLLSPDGWATAVDKAGQVRQTRRYFLPFCTLPASQRRAYHVTRRQGCDCHWCRPRHRP